MTKNKHIAFIALFVSILLTSIACSDEVTTSSEIDSASPVNISMRTFAPYINGTRTVTPTTESLIRDLTIITFNGSKHITGYSYTEYTPSGTQSGSVIGRQGNGVDIYIIANIGKTKANRLFNLLTEQNFKDSFINIVAAKVIETDSTYLPMFAKVESQNIWTSSYAISTPIKLVRLVTKINLVIKYKAKSIVNNYTVCHIPLSCYIHPNVTSNPSAKFGNLPMVVNPAYVPAPPIASLVAGELKDTIYMFENLAGNGAVGIRNYLNAPSDATYINLNITRATGTYDYRIYFGGITPFDTTTVSPTNNYDLPRNYEYFDTIYVDSVESSNGGVNTTMLPTFISGYNTIEQWVNDSDSIATYNY